MTNPYFYTLMMQWVNFIVFFFCASFFGNSQANAQQSNPFDIIITKDVDANETIDITPSQDTTEVLSTKAPDKLLDPNSTITSIDSTTIFDSLEVALPPVININNPFNIQKTSERTEGINENTINNSPLTPQSNNDITIDAAPPSQSESSWFSNLKLKEAKSSSREYSLNFIFWILIASILILAAVINLKRKSFLNLYRAITNDNYLKLLQREEFNGSSFFFLLLYFLFFLNTALFLYQLLIDKFEVKGYKIFLILFFSLIIIYVVRLISIFVLHKTFPLEKVAKQYNFTIIMFNIIVGLLLIPVNILTAYAPFGPKMLYVGLGIIALFYVLRQIRGLFIAARIKGLSYFHFFIYLCTFEVAPVFWIISFVKNWYSVS